MAKRADLIVVGAGPGGSSTAYHAARAGLEVLLLDLGDWLDEPHHGKFSGFSIYTQSAFLRQKVPPTLHGPYGYVVAREETDARLLMRAQEAGADFRSGVRATKLLR